MRGAAAMAMGLIALQVLLSTPLADLLGAAAAPAAWARNWMDPAVPLIPPRFAGPPVSQAQAQALLQPVNMAAPPPPAGGVRLTAPAVAGQ